MKISFGIIVLNGEPFIKYNLEVLYPHAHEIIVVEGAVEKFRHAATQDGHSLDNTVKIIREFPDPDGKIKLIQKNDFWPEKNEMANAYLKECTGDYVWHIDVDEFYKDEDILKIKKILFEQRDIARIDVKAISFGYGFAAVMNGAPFVYGLDETRRIFKFRPGWYFSTHRPPTVVDTDGKEIGGKVIEANELAKEHGIFMYHYSYIFSEGIKSKSIYYAQMNWGKGCEGGLSWFENYWKKLINPLRVHLINFPPSWLTPFEGSHPRIIEKLIRETSYMENKDLLEFLKSDWKKYASAGEKATKAYLSAEQKKAGRLEAALKILSALLFPVDLRTFRADKTILSTFFKCLSH